MGAGAPHSQIKWGSQMKKPFSFLISAFALFVTSQTAWAAFSIEELNTATKTATEDFKIKQPDHTVHFTGYKSWLSGDDAKVKVYVSHDGMTMDFNYLCHKHDPSIECHAQ